MNVYFCVEFSTYNVYVFVMDMWPLRLNPNTQAIKLYVKLLKSIFSASIGDILSYSVIID